MKIKVLRDIFTEKSTTGHLHIDGAWQCYTLEDRVRANGSKIYGETAIPKGTYEVAMTWSGKFNKKAWAKPTKGLVPEILDVPGYSGVRIHPLNCAKDSLGCIGVGKNDKKGWISNSTAYYRNLVDNYIVPALDRGERVFITIK